MFSTSRNLTNTDSVKQALDRLGTFGTVTELPQSNTVIKRDVLGGASVTTLAANAIESIGTTLNIASQNTTQNLNIGSGSGVQSINVGNNGAGSTTINLGGAGDVVNIAGTLTTVNTTNTQVMDKSLVLNSGGSLASSGTSGVYFEENGDNSSSFIRIGSDRTKVEMKPAAGNLITLNQSLATGDTPTFASVTASGNTIISGNGAVVYSNGNGGIRKRLVLFERGVASDINDHRFDGMGKIANEMIFQIGAGSIVYYSANDAANSTEMMRIWPGTVSVPTLLTVGTGQITNSSFTTPGALTLTSTNAGVGIATFKLQNINGCNGCMIDTTGAANALADILYKTGAFAMTARYEARPGFMNDALNVTYGEAQFLLNTSANAAYFGLGRSGVNSTFGIGGSNHLKFPSQLDVRKRIVFLESGDATSSTDHRFAGFGKGSSQVIYQTGGTIDDHVFYAATSAATSNELMRIKGNGAVSIPGTLAVTGNSSTAGSLTFSGADQGIAFTGGHFRRRIILADNGSSNTDHRFAGIGKELNIMLFQAPAVTDDHVFYAATGAATSNELMRIKGNGAVQIPGTLTVNGASMLAGGATVQGALNVQYNVSCGTVTTTGSVGCATMTATGNVSCGGLTVNGSTIFSSGVSVQAALNVQYNVSCGTVIATGNVGGATLTATGNASCASLTATGNVGCATLAATGNVSCASLTVGGTAYTAPPAYEEYDLSTTFILGTYTSSSVTLRFTRIGRVITVYTGSAIALSGSATNDAFVSTAVVPVAWRTGPSTFLISVDNNGVRQVGEWGINTISGKVTIASAGSGNFIGTGSHKWLPCSFSYQS